VAATCVKKGTTDSTANRHIQSSCEELPVGISACNLKQRTSHVQQKKQRSKADREPPRMRLFLEGLFALGSSSLDKPASSLPLKSKICSQWCE
jgi:hypothetical protein